MRDYTEKDFIGESTLYGERLHRRGTTLHEKDYIKKNYMTREYMKMEYTIRRKDYTGLHGEGLYREELHGEG